MIKLIESCSEDFGETSVRIIDDWTGQGLVKAAADSQITEFVSGLTPEQGKVYLHILAMTAGEFYSSNRNGDWFPEENLKQYYKTFETTPAHVFRNHVNKNPAIAIGQVILSIYNERMHRVELIAWVDKTKGADIVERLERGEFPATSMALRTPYDVCSVCGNKAHTRQEYCEHLNEQLNRMYPDGRKVMAINSAPLTAFDISIVVRPADPVSAVMQKVASLNTAPGGVSPVGSAVLAERLGLSEKSASLKKLSELLKDVEGEVMDYSAGEVLKHVKDPESHVIPELAKHDLSEVLSTMAHLGISPSVGYLAELIGHKLSGPSAAGIGDLIEKYIEEDGVHSLIGNVGELNTSSVPNRKVVELLSSSVKQASLLPNLIEERSAGIFDHMRYNDPRYTQLLQEKANLEKELAEAKAKPGLLKSLIMIGGAALAAKWVITKAIQEHQKQQAPSNVNNSGVKIVLVKSSSDYTVTYKLAKQAMLKYLR